MATNGAPKRGKITDEQIKNLLRASSKPVLTAVDIGDELGVSNEAVRYRLKRMEDRGEVGSKAAGSSAVVWWVIED